MLFPGRNHRQPPGDDLGASEDARRLAGRAPDLVQAAAGSEWYHEHGTPVDRAALTLCRLRRARAGQWRSPTAGDEAVREALESADAAAVIWLASRAISYMDENGFPETVSPYFDY